MKVLTAFSCCLILFNEQIAGYIYFAVDKFESCEKYQSGFIIYNNSKIIQGDKAVSLSYDTYITKSLTSGVEAELNIVKCMNKENQNSCMPFYNLKIGKLCRFLSGGSDKLFSFSSCVKPDFVCPLKKNKYVASNCMIDMSQMRMIPVSTGYWKIEILFSEPKLKKNVGCLSMIGEVKEKY